jgi:hypothetical protein
MQAEASADLTKKQGLLDSLGFPEPSLIITQGLKKTDYQDLRFPVNFFQLHIYFKLKHTF